MIEHARTGTLETADKVLPRNKPFNTHSIGTHDKGAEVLRLKRRDNVLNLAVGHLDRPISTFGPQDLSNSHVHPLGHWLTQPRNSAISVSYRSVGRRSMSRWRIRVIVIDAAGPGRRIAARKRLVEGFIHAVIWARSRFACGTGHFRHHGLLYIADSKLIAARNLMRGSPTTCCRETPAPSSTLRTMKERDNVGPRPRGLRSVWSRI